MLEALEYGHSVVPASVATLARANLLHLQLHLNREPFNDTVGLVTTKENHVLYLGNLYVTDIVGNLTLSDGSPISADAAHYLAHRSFFHNNPLHAIADYVSRLYSLMLSSPDSNLINEFKLWQELYRRRIEHVLDHVTVPDKPLGGPHIMWHGRDYPDYVGRPRANVQGLQRIPIYKLLWPRLRPSEPMPSGHPVKLPGRCGEVFSEDAEQCTRMCVNPHHFIEAAEIGYESVLYTEPGIEAAEQRVQWRMRDLSEPRMWADGTWAATCPNDHVIEGNDYDRLMRDDITEITCRGCRRMMALTKDVRGRLVRRTRNKHEPLLSEMAEARRLQQIIRSDVKQDDDIASWTPEQWAAEVDKLAQQNPDD